MNRPGKEQKIHDLVLADSAASYLKITTAENIMTNPAGHREHEIDGKYPDLIVKLPTGEIIIEEIETESTVNQEELRQWQEFTSLGYDFRLIVPVSLLETVKSMVTDVAVNVQAYEVVDGRVHWFGKNT